jgi:uncharacterized protein YciU (UPF0263 family)
MHSEFVDADKVLALCEDIFFELADENLESDVMQLMEKNAGKLFIEIQDELSDWQAFLPEVVNLDDFLEVKIFLELKNCNSLNLATLLVPVDFEMLDPFNDEQSCHIRWL